MIFPSPNETFSTVSVKTGKAQCEQMFSALPLRADIAQHERDVRKVPCVDGSGLARIFFTFAALVGAAMCSAC
jgi:hypothetical protein